MTTDPIQLILEHPFGYLTILVALAAYVSGVRIFLKQKFAPTAEKSKDSKYEAYKQKCESWVSAMIPVDFFLIVGTICVLIPLFFSSAGEIFLFISLACLASAIISLSALHYLAWIEHFSTREKEQKKRAEAKNTIEDGDNEKRLNLLRLLPRMSAYISILFFLIPLTTLLLAGTKSVTPSPEATPSLDLSKIESGVSNIQGDVSKISERDFPNIQKDITHIRENLPNPSPSPPMVRG